MAAVTFWVDPVSGDDANDGLSFAQAKETNNGTAAAINVAGNGNDYTINLVNSGDHSWTGFATQIGNQTSSTFLIRGSDSSGNPALASVVAASDINTPTKPFFYIREHAGMTVEYIDMDSSAATSGHAFIYSRLENDPAVQTTVRFCKFLSNTLPSTSSINFQPVYRGSQNNTDFEYYGCYFEGQANFVNSLMSTFGDTKIHDCVIIDEGEKSLFGALGTSSFAAVGVELYNNTVFLKATSGTGSAPIINPIIQHSVFSGTVPGWTIKNNVFWKDVSPDYAGTISSGSFIRGSGPGSAVYDGNEDIGYNMFYTGPNVFGSGHENIDNYLSNPFIGAPYTGDVRRDNVTEASAFNDTSSTYDWTPTGSAVALTIARDLRPLIDTDAGEGGAAPGALPLATTDFTVQAGTTRSAPKEGESLILRAAITNSGVDSTDVDVTVSVPAGLTVVTETPSAGTYNGGVWTLNVDDGAVETLLLSCTVDTGTAGTDLTFTVTVTDGNPGPGGDTSDDTDSTVISVLEEVVTDPESPAAQPYLDVIPVRTTELQADLNVALQTKRNRLRRHYLRSDTEDRLWRESSLRRLEVGTNTTTKLNLGGIQRGQFLFLESTTQIDVSAGNDTNLYLSAKVIVLQDGDFEQVHVRNTSTTASATVLYGVID